MHVFLCIALIACSRLTCACCRPSDSPVAGAVNAGHPHSRAGRPSVNPDAGAFVLLRHPQPARSIHTCWLALRICWLVFVHPSIHAHVGWPGDSPVASASDSRRSQITRRSQTSPMPTSFLSTFSLCTWSRAMSLTRRMH